MRRITGSSTRPSNSRLPALVPPPRNSLFGNRQDVGPAIAIPVDAARVYGPHSGGDHLRSESPVAVVSKNQQPSGAALLSDEKIGPAVAIEIRHVEAVRAAESVGNPMLGP